MLFHLERKVTLPYKHSMLFYLERKVTLPLDIQCCSTLNVRLPYLYKFNVVLP
jgi:hypothetical protein